MSEIKAILILRKERHKINELKKLLPGISITVLADRPLQLERKVK